MAVGALHSLPNLYSKTADQYEQSGKKIASALVDGNLLSPASSSNQPASTHTPSDATPPSTFKDFLSPHKITTPEQKQKSAKAFEEMYLTFFFKRIMPQCEDGFFGGGHTNDMYKQLWVDALAKQVSDKGGLGIAKTVERSIAKSMNASPDSEIPEYTHESYDLLQSPSKAFIPQTENSHPNSRGGQHDFTL